MIGKLDCHMDLFAFGQKRGPVCRLMIDVIVPESDWLQRPPGKGEYFRVFVKKADKIVLPQKRIF